VDYSYNLIIFYFIFLINLIFYFHPMILISKPESKIQKFMDKSIFFRYIYKKYLISKKIKIFGVDLLGQNIAILLIIKKLELLIFHQKTFIIIY